jgi:hypothetical protein
VRVLLDENLPHDLIAELTGHDVVTRLAAGGGRWKHEPPRLMHAGLGGLLSKKLGHL